MASVVMYVRCISTHAEVTCFLAFWLFAWPFLSHNIFNAFIFFIRAVFMQIIYFASQQCWNNYPYSVHGRWNTIMWVVLKIEMNWWLTKDELMTHWKWTKLTWLWQIWSVFPTYFYNYLWLLFAPLSSFKSSRALEYHFMLSRYFIFVSVYNYMYACQTIITATHTAMAKQWPTWEIALA